MTADRVVARGALLIAVRIGGIAIAFRGVRASSQTGIGVLLLIAAVRSHLCRVDSGRQRRCRCRRHALALCDRAIRVVIERLAWRRIIVARYQRVGVGKPDRIARRWHRRIVAAPGLQIFHTATIEQCVHLAALRSSLPALRLRIDERLAVIDSIRFEARICILILPAPSDLSQRYRDARNVLARRRIDANRAGKLAVARTGRCSPHEKQECDQLLHCVRAFKAMHWSDVQLLMVLVSGNCRGAPVPLPLAALQPELTPRMDGVHVDVPQLTL